MRKCVRYLLPDVFCTRPDTGTVCVQDHTTNEPASNFCGSMCDNDDGALKPLRPAVMPLPEKELSMVSPEFSKFFKNFGPVLSADSLPNPCLTLPHSEN
jgi:hypothetical protein